MERNKSLTIIICYSLLAHICVATRSIFLYIDQVVSVIFPIYCVLSVMMLLYPLWGHLADVWLTRYRVLVVSSAFMSTGLTLFVVLSLFDVVEEIATPQIIHSTISANIVMVVLGFIGGIVVAIGQGLFEVNAIQFGLDQLLESPTEQLIAFIHWYYWSQQTAVVLLYYTFITVNIATSQCVDNHRLMTLVMSVTIALTAIGSLLLILCSRKHLYVQRPGLNPFRNVYRVLQYSWKHKVPQRRSAFTYWEDDIPPRIDVGKNKYGGPFTNEEVEDTKTFLQILPLLFSMVGFYLTGNGYSAAQQFQQFSCPSIPVLVLIVLNPQHLSSLVAVIAIPLYQMVIRKTSFIKKVLMLTRMWIGLYLCLVQVIFYLILALNHDTTYWQQHHTVLHDDNSYGKVHSCVKIRFGYTHRNITCKTYDDPIDNTYLLFIIPQLLNGLSFLFVFMTALEFICAQAPHTTQGLLIGVWYAISSIKYLVIGLLDTLITEKRSWLISEGVKGLLILLYLILFHYLTKHYKYRQREEIVNVQAMIEDTHDKWMKQEEEYMKERRAILEKLHKHSPFIK